MAAPRKIDYDEARRLYADGVSQAEIARRLGVTPTAIFRVLNDEYRRRDAERVTAWLRGGVCPDCGGPATRVVGTATHRNGRCRACHAKAAATSVRADALQCGSCREWKPDRAFPRNRGDQHRRGRHGQCQACNTKAKRDWRKRNPGRDSRRFAGVPVRETNAA